MTSDLSSFVIKAVQTDEPAVRIDDTTLRDGEQTAGVVFSNHEKIRIAKLLDEVGVHQIEVGIPAMLGDEKETIRQIVELGLKPSILAWNRAVVADNPAQVAQYRGGKQQVLGFFVGQVMKATQGRADPKLVNELVRKALEA